MIYYVSKKNELYHHGVKGMKWGVRRNRQTASADKKKKRMLSPEEEAARKETRRARAKKALKIGAIAGGSALAVCGTIALAVAGSKLGAKGKKATSSLFATDNDTFETFKVEEFKFDEFKFDEFKY